MLGNLRLPVLLQFASSPAAHWRDGRIDWRLFFWLIAPPSGRLDDAALLRVISVILVVADLGLAAEAVLG